MSYTQYYNHMYQPREESVKGQASVWVCRVCGLPPPLIYIYIYIYTHTYICNA